MFKSALSRTYESYFYREGSFLLINTDFFLIDILRRVCTWVLFLRSISSFVVMLLMVIIEEEYLDSQKSLL